jgi:hypothetical protein
MLILSVSFKNRIKELAGIITETDITTPQIQPQQTQQQAQQVKFPDSNQIDNLLNTIKEMFEKENARVGDSTSSYTDIPSKFDVVIKHVKTTNNTDYMDIFMEKKNKNYLDHIIQQFGGEFSQHFRNDHLIALTMVRGIKKLNENFYQNLSPKQAIEKANVDYGFAIKQNNSGQANKIIGNLKSYLETQNYNWKQDPRALEILSDFV